MGLAPAHRVDHIPVYILPFDLSWDMDAVRKDTAKLEGEAFKSHPWVRYHDGSSRCDLSTVAQWLIPEIPPARFVMRRLTRRQWNAVEAKESVSVPDARDLALRYGLEAIEGIDCELDRGGAEDGPLSSDDLDRLLDLVGTAGLVNLGQMAIAVSRRELQPAEKKL
ncbi:MAG TPA: hypothetical protein VM487_11275 [Phycisphaerae bacterium]|nr:hypothetical protein [Phycisphaerae bacterium]